MKFSLWNFILSKNHVLPSPLANKIGIPVIRVIISNLLIFLRRLKNCRAQTTDEKKLIDDGIIVIPNFLPNEDFFKLKQEINNQISNSNDFKISEAGSTKTKSFNIDSEKCRNYPAIQKFIENKELIRLISVGEGKRVFNQIDSFRFETIKFGDPQNDTDINVPFHADVHFHSHKVLFYIDNVTMDNAPFAYCVKSHKNNFKRLWFEFRRGLLSNAHESSWRIEDNLNKKFVKDYFNDLMKMKLKVIAKPNTLIIANVHGFHQRGKAINETERSIIRISYRYNPLKGHKSLPVEKYSGSFF